MSQLTRRRFLEDSILATAASAAAASLPAPLLLAQEPRSANEKVTAAIIGCGIRGKQHAGVLSGLGDCDVAYVCDPDQARMAEVSAILVEKGRPAPKSVADMRKVFEDKSV